MKKIFYAMVLLSVTACFVAACSDDEPNNDGGNTDIEEVVPGTNHKILVAYFSEPLPDGVDAVTSASRVIVDGDLYGSVQYVATVIREATGGDMVRIQTAQPYPGNFDDLADQANNERQNDIHPALATEIDNFDDYDVVFVGYPIWWYHGNVFFLRQIRLQREDGHSFLHAWRKRMVGNFGGHQRISSECHDGWRLQYFTQQHGDFKKRYIELVAGNRYDRIIMYNT